MGRGVLTATIALARIVVGQAVAAAHGRTPLYAVTMSGSLSTSSFVPAHEEDGCWLDAVSGVRTLSFRSAHAVRVPAGAAMSALVPVRAMFSAGGTPQQHKQCDNGTTSTIVMDWAAAHTVTLGPVAFHAVQRRVWLDGIDDDISGACFGAPTPPSPAGLADAYARMPARIGKTLTLHGEEDEQAQGDGCMLVRSIRWKITFRRVS